MKSSFRKITAIICICAFIQPSVTSAYRYGGYRFGRPRSSEPHYDHPPTSYDEPKSYYREPEPHYEEHEPHYKDPAPLMLEALYNEPEHQIKETGLDPHGKGKQCVDVSTYSFPTFVKKDKKCCKTIFKKKIIPKTEKVCKEVTSQYCDVLPFTECHMKMTDKNVKESHWVYKFVPVYTCVERIVDIVHTKKKPVCSKTPKEVCNSKWKISPEGKKVYVGKEDCKTIYVDNCILKEVPEIIKVPKPQCSVAHKAPYMTIETKKVPKTFYSMECKVLKKNHCEAHTKEDCKEITYTESKDIPVKTCDPTNIKVPKQHLEHKKKCLFMKHNGLNHETYKL